MAATYTVTRVAVPGDLKSWECTITGDSSYATGGYAVTPASFGMNSITGIVPLGVVAGNVAQYDATNAKIRFIVAATGAEVANTTNVATSILPVIVYGK
jgi:hypothetical protein